MKWLFVVVAVVGFTDSQLCAVNVGAVPAARAGDQARPLQLQPKCLQPRELLQSRRDARNAVVVVMLSWLVVLVPGDDRSQS